MAIGTRENENQMDNFTTTKYLADILSIRYDNNGREKKPSKAQTIYPNIICFPIASYLNIHASTYTGVRYSSHNYYGSPLGTLLSDMREVTTDYMYDSR